MLDLPAEGGPAISLHEWKGTLVATCRNKVWIFRIQPSFIQAATGFFLPPPLCRKNLWWTTETKLGSWRSSFISAVCWRNSPSLYMQKVSALAGCRNRTRIFGIWASFLHPTRVWAASVCKGEFVWGAAEMGLRSSHRDLLQGATKADSDLLRSDLCFCSPSEDFPSLPCREENSSKELQKWRSRPSGSVLQFCSPTEEFLSSLSRQPFLLSLNN